MAWIKLFEKIAILPLNLVRDVATLGGIFEDKSEPSTWKNIKEIGKEIDDIVEE